LAPLSFVSGCRVLVAVRVEVIDAIYSFYLLPDALPRNLSLLLAKLFIPDSPFVFALSFRKLRG